MADSTDLELEGETDDMEFELLTVMGGSDKKAVKPQQSKVHQSASKNSTVTGTDKSKPGTLSNSGSSSQLTVTPAKKLPPRKQPDHTKKPVTKHTSDVGDIADLIGILDSDSKKAGEVLPKIHTQTEDSKTEAVASKTASPSLAATGKRKSSVSDNTDSVKIKKVDDVKDECPEPMDDTNEKVLIKDEKVAVTDAKVAVTDENIVTKDEKNVPAAKDEKAAEKILLCSEEDSRIIDTELVEEMMDKVKRRTLPLGDRCIVKFSPVEIGDLAEESVQKLITSQPNLVFYFKRQGKLKKKKGYAEVYLSKVQDAVVFVEKLLQLKLLECRIEVTITVPKLKKDEEVLSFVVWLDKNSKLVKLRSPEDVSKAPLDTTKEHLQIEQVPASADIQMLRILFPFAADVKFSPQQKTMESGFKGPVNVSYINAGLLEAVLDCCSEHTYSGHSLSIQYTKKKQAKPDTEVKREIDADNERRNSAHDKNGDIGSKTEKDGASSSSANHKSENVTSLSISEEGSVDEDISNMTRDVCSGMMESLNKLRQLGTDNPNVMKILEMQNELLKLQKTLVQSTESEAVTEEDPWTVTAADSIDDKQNKQDGSEKEHEKKLPKEQKKKPEKESRAEKQRREMEDLQRRIEEEEEAKRQREERAKRQVEIEKQKMKELEEKRKANWARRVIEDAKQSPTLGTGENASSKEEVQRILKRVENKRKEAEEAKKVEETKGSETPESEQAARNAGGPDEIAQKLPTSRQDGDDEPQKDTQDTDTDVVAWSPSRTLHEGAPVYSEEEFTQVCSSYTAGVLPWDHHIRITYYADRRCPVESCPATKYFKTAESFVSHWSVFHTQKLTVKFCQKCNAYFTSTPELETHLHTRHSITSSQAVKKMVKEAREKVIPNPSFRNPGKYLPPLV